VARFGERYELIDRIGSGGMGEVWLAYDEELANRPVAIKIMHQHMLPNENDVARFEREMRFAAMMDHPNIVTVYTTGTYDDAPFMVMEYLRGHDLENEPADGDAERIARMGKNICDALAYAHRKGVLHRDIKPSNLFLCESGQVKITDFGVARAVGGATLTSAGVLVGTFAYMPPERWRGDQPAFGNDIWAVGCVLYRLISGRLPRVLPGAADYAAAAMRGDPIPHLRDITEAPAWLTGPVMAMLAADPGDRPAAGDCARLLSGVQSPARSRALRGRGRALAGRVGPSEPEPGPVIGAAGAGSGTTVVARPAAAPRKTARSRRLNRAALAVAGLALLVLAGSVTAWRLSAAPHTAQLAARATVTSSPATTSPPATPARAATTPADSATASRPSAGAPAPGSATPATSRPAASTSPSAGSSHSASPKASPSATPSGSPSVSASPSTTPPLVAVPDVVGMTYTEAKKVLKTAGFVVVPKHTKVGQIVVRTNPASEAPAGSSVIVVY
jgi:serine/threonine protein kinase